MNNFETLKRDAFHAVGNFKTRFYDESGEVVVGAENNILVNKILPAIKNIKTMDEFNDYSLGWFFDDRGEDGDVVVSVYTLDEVYYNEFTLDNLSVKANYANDEDAQKIIVRALTTKFKELNNISGDEEKYPFNLNWIEEIAKRAKELELNQRPSQIESDQLTVAPEDCVKAIVEDDWKTLEDPRKTLEDYKKAKEDYEKAKEDLRKALKNYKKAKKDLRKTLKNYKKAYEDPRKAYEDYEKAYEDLRKTYEDYEKAYEDLRKTQKNYKKAKEDLRKTQKNYKKAKEDYEKAYERRVENWRMQYSYSGDDNLPAVHSDSPSTCQKFIEFIGLASLSNLLNWH